MEFKLYQCAQCGNVAYKVVDQGTPLVCCGEKMKAMQPNTTDAALEKHVPVIEKTPNDCGYAVTVKVGSVEHPMQPEHFINFIAAVSGETVTIKQLHPGEKPEMCAFSTDGEVTAYEWCNLHGYWIGT